MQTRQEPTAPTHHHNDWQKWGGQHGNKICTLPAVTSDDQSCEDTQPAETNARAAVAQKTGHTMTVVTQVWPGGCCPACPVSFEETYGKHKPNTRFPERTSGYSDDAPWSGPKAGGGSMRCRKAGFCVFENASIHRLAARRTMTNVLTLTQVKLLTLERTQRYVFVGLCPCPKKVPAAAGGAHAKQHAQMKLAKSSSTATSNGRRKSCRRTNAKPQTPARSVRIRSKARSEETVPQLGWPHCGIRHTRKLNKTKKVPLPKTV